jgi:hypothetical protein
LAEKEDTQTTQEQPAITDEVARLAAARAATIDVLKDAEIKLGRLGDYFHELRRQVEAVRARLEAIP